MSDGTWKDLQGAVLLGALSSLGGRVNAGDFVRPRAEQLLLRFSALAPIALVLGVNVGAQLVGPVHAPLRSKTPRAA